MASIPQAHLFSWKEIEASSDLDRLRLVLQALPDEPFVRHLESRRGRGRNDYPIRPVWNAIIAGIVFQHPSVASLRRELRRNGELRELCGFNPLQGARAVPTDHAFSRFLALLISERDRLLEIFNQLVTELGRQLPDLGQKLAVDSKAIRSHGRPVGDQGRQQGQDRRRDTDADWGSKSYRGKRKDGSGWEKVIRWFGYKLHLLVDSVHELPLSFKLTKASGSDSPELLTLVEELAEHHPELAHRASELSADKGYDSRTNNQTLYQEHGIVPVIDKRKLWQDGEETRLLFPDRLDRFVYDEDGGVHCICPVTGEVRELFFCGFEQRRGSLKYRCPAAASGFECHGRAECEAVAAVGPYGRVIRVPLALDPRIFTPIARHTRKWKKSYQRRTAVERVNARLDRVLGFEEHYIRGQQKMETRVTLALIVILAMALGRIKAHQRHLIRSFTLPVARAA